MTAVVVDLTSRPALIDSGEVEVATVVADSLRASIRVTGLFAPRAVPLLMSVLSTHLGGGRRYLRVDLGGASLPDPTVELLVGAQRTVRAAGGTLVFENAGPVLIDAIRGAQLFVTSA